MGGDGLGARGLGAEPELLRGQAQDPHVGLHVALAVEQRGVAALTGLEGLDVVGELALKQLCGVGTRELEA